jgi:hypothetical protein
MGWINVKFLFDEINILNSSSRDGLRQKTISRYCPFKDASRDVPKRPKRPCTITSPAIG